MASKEERFNEAQKLYAERNFAAAAPLFEALANEGYYQAQVAIGNCYFYARGVQYDFDKARDWYMKATEQEKGQGYGEAHYQWQDLCSWSGSPTLRFEKTMELFAQEKFDHALPRLELLANDGHAEAQYTLGNCYAFGKGGLSKDIKQAVQWWLKAAEKGCAEAQHNLGFSFQTGKGVEQDNAKAVEWWQKAAVQGFTNSQDALGDCYSKGIGVEQDLAQAAKWYRMAGAQGDADAQKKYEELAGQGITTPPDTAYQEERFKKALELYKAKRYDEAVPILEGLAAEGHAGGQYYLGRCYHFAQGVNRDYPKVGELYRKAAEQGLVEAQFALGDCYREGLYRGVPEDMSKTVEWWSKAGEQGHTEAQFLVGECYYYGEGVEQDKATAGEWWKKAAEGGDKQAKYRLESLAAESEDVLETITAANVMNMWGEFRYDKPEGALVKKGETFCGMALDTCSDWSRPKQVFPLPPAKFSGTLHYLVKDGATVNLGEPVAHILKKCKNPLSML